MVERGSEIRKKARIKNYYYLVAGILAIIFSVSHIWNGQNVVLPTLNVVATPIDTKTMFIYVWHIVSGENILFGVVFLLMSVHRDLSKVRFTAWIIVFVMIVRWIIILGSTLAYNAKGFGNTWMESLAFTVFISTIILGIRVKNKQIGEYKEG
jgi:uncharacterized membrane protein